MVHVHDRLICDWPCSGKKNLCYPPLTSLNISLLEGARGQCYIQSHQKHYKQDTQPYGNVMSSHLTPMESRTLLSFIHIKLFKSEEEDSESQYVLTLSL